MSVTVSLTFDTDHPKETILRTVIDELSALTQQPTSVHAFDLNDDDQDGPTIQFVIYAEGGGITRTYIDDADQAAEHAELIHGVVVELPIVGDFRVKDGGR